MLCTMISKIKSIKNRKSPRDLGDVKKAKWGIFPVNLEENPKDSKNILYRKLVEGFGLRGLKEEWGGARRRRWTEQHRTESRYSAPASPASRSGQQAPRPWLVVPGNGRRETRRASSWSRWKAWVALRSPSRLSALDRRRRGRGKWMLADRYQCVCLYRRGTVRVPGKWMLAGTPSAPPRGTGKTSVLLMEVSQQK